MALTTEKTVVVPLKGANYPTWKVQVKMALMKDDLWGFADGTEIAPSGEGGRGKVQGQEKQGLGCDCAGSESLSALLDWRSQGTERCLDEARESFPEEDLGK